MINDILLDAIGLGDTLLVSSLLDGLEEHENLTNVVDWRLIKSTAVRGTNVEVVEKVLTVPMDFQLRTELNVSGAGHYEKKVQNLVREAVEGGSTDIVEWLLQKCPKFSRANPWVLMNATLESSLDMMRLMLLYDILSATETLIILAETRDKTKSPSRDIEMAELLLEHGANIGDIWLNARCSLELATFLVDKGLSVNRRKADASRPATALYDAVRANTPHGSAMAQMLLENGADPTMKCCNRSIHDLAGAKNFQKWLGITLDELVQSTWGTRQQVHDETMSSPSPLGHPSSDESLADVSKKRRRPEVQETGQSMQEGNLPSSFNLNHLVLESKPPRKRHHKSRK